MIPRKDFQTIEIFDPCVTVFAGVRQMSSIAVETQISDMQEQFNQVLGENETFADVFDFGDESIRLPKWMNREFLAKSVSAYLKTDSSMSDQVQAKSIELTKKLANLQHKALHEIQAKDIVGKDSDESK